MKLSEQQSDFLWMESDLINHARQFFPVGDICPKTKDGIYIKVTCWDGRTMEQQRENVRTGKSSTLKSKHFSGLAVDLQLMKDGQPIYEHELYSILGIYWVSIGGEWGGEWTKPYDPFHFQYNIERRREWESQQQDYHSP